MPVLYPVLPVFYPVLPVLSLLCCLQQFFDGCQFRAQSKQSGCCLQILDRREGRSNADIAVMRVISARPGRTGRRHGDAGFGTFQDNFFRAAIHGVEGNEVSAFRIGPSGDPEASQFLFQDALHCLKLRAQDVCVFPHVLHQAVDVLEEADVAQLVDLVVADRLHAELVLDVLKVIQG